MVNWTLQAQKDVHRIFDYIKTDSRRYARSVTDKIYETGDSLDKFFRRGRILPELNDPSVREIFAFSYRIIYENYQHQIYVLAVIHMSRMITEKMLKRI